MSNAIVVAPDPFYNAILANLEPDPDGKKTVAVFPQVKPGRSGVDDSVHVSMPGEEDTKPISSDRVFVDLLTHLVSYDATDVNKLIDLMGDTAKSLQGATSPDIGVIVNAAKRVHDLLNALSGAARDKERHRPAGFNCSTFVPLGSEDDAPGKNDFSEGELVGCGAKLDYHGFFWATDDDGDSSFTFDLLLQSGDAEDRLVMVLGKEGASGPDAATPGKVVVQTAPKHHDVKIMTQSGLVTVKHDKDGGKQDAQAFKVDEGYFHVFSGSLELESVDLADGGFPLTIAASITTASELDTPDVPVLGSLVGLLSPDNSTMVALDPLKLTLTPEHEKETHKTVHKRPKKTTEPAQPATDGPAHGNGKEPAPPKVQKAIEHLYDASDLIRTSANLLEGVLQLSPAEESSSRPAG
jgi:hypothetical protein